MSKKYKQFYSQNGPHYVSEEQSRCRFHQQFTSSFCADILLTKCNKTKGKIQTLLIWLGTLDVRYWKEISIKIYKKMSLWCNNVYRRDEFWLLQELLLYQIWNILIKSLFKFKVVKLWILTHSWLNLCFEIFYFSPFLVIGQDI